MNNLNRIAKNDSSILVSTHLKSIILSIRLEYAIAFLGSMECGLAATTVNPSYTSEEISRQMLSCRPKAVICLAENFTVVERACRLTEQPNIKIITLQCDPNDSKPRESISFNELMSTDGERTQFQV